MTVDLHPFEGLNYQQYIYFSDFETCDLLANNATGSDCDDTDSELNYHDYDGDGQSSCDGDCDDFDGQRNTLDIDGDGTSSCDGDCADNNPNVSVGTDRRWRWLFRMSD